MIFRSASHVALEVETSSITAGWEEM
jgi:hypothetical protein